MEAARMLLNVIQRRIHPQRASSPATHASSGSNFYAATSSADRFKISRKKRGRHRPAAPIFTTASLHGRTAFKRTNESRYDQQNEEDKEERPRNIGGRARNSREPKDPGDNRHDEKD